MTPASRLDIDIQLIEPPEDSRVSNLDHLKLEMERTQSQLGIQESFELVWRPQPRGKLAGEVKNQTIYIYVQDLPSAISTVRHEVVDYWLTQLLQAPLDWSDAAMQGLGDLIESIRMETTMSPALQVVISRLAGLINIYTQAFSNTLYVLKEERVDTLCQLLGSGLA